MPTRNWSNQKDMIVKGAARSTTFFHSADSPARVEIDNHTGMVTAIEVTDARQVARAMSVVGDVPGVTDVRRK